MIIVLGETREGEGVHFTIELIVHCTNSDL